MHLLPRSGNFGLGTWPLRRARIAPDAPALSQGHRVVTWSQLANRTARLTAALTELGVVRGERVAYLGPNDLAIFETFFATAQVGAVFVPLNTRLAAAELQYMLRDCEPAVLVLDEAVGFEPTELVTGGVTRIVNKTDLDALVEAHEPAAPLANLPLEDPALFLFTSGTTGRAKAAMLTHSNIFWNTVNQLAHIDFLSTDRALCVAPLFHSVGFGQITLPVLFKGGQVELLPKFDAAAMLETIEQLKITGFAAVPTILQMLAEHPSWNDTDLSSLRHVNYGGSPANERITREWQRRGVTLQQGYGMTEAGPGVLMASAEGGLDRPMAAGVPHVFTDIAHLADDGHAVPVDNTPRELLIRGPHVFAGYWGRPEDSAAEVVDSEWFRTGDVLRFEDGWGYVVDRVKDVIISGAENIYPAEVEAVLAAAPGVRSAAVVGIPDDRWGEVGLAYVEALPGFELDPDEVLDYARSQLAKYKVPTQVHVLSELPRNAAGKVLRQELRLHTANPSDSSVAISPEGTP